MASANAGGPGVTGGESAALIGMAGQVVARWGVVR